MFETNLQTTKENGRYKTPLVVSIHAFQGFHIHLVHSTKPVDVIFHSLGGVLNRQAEPISLSQFHARAHSMMTTTSHFLYINEANLERVATMLALDHWFLYRQ